MPARSDLVSREYLFKMIESRRHESERILDEGNIPYYGEGIDYVHGLINSEWTAQYHISEAPKCGDINDMTSITAYYDHIGRESIINTIETVLHEKESKLEEFRASGVDIGIDYMRGMIVGLNSILYYLTYYVPKCREDMR